MKNRRIRTLFTLTLLLVAWLATLPQVRAAVVWSTDTPFTTADSLDQAPAMVQALNGRVFMFWHSDYGSTNWDIFYNYTDGPVWSKAFRLTTNAANDGEPTAVTAQDGKIWVFWKTDRDGPPGNSEIYYKTSSDNGAHWSIDLRLTWNVNVDSRPSVMQAHDGNIWVAWYSNRDGNDEIYYNKFDGTWWGLDQRLTNNPAPDGQPSIIQDDAGRIWVFWSAERTGDFALYYKTSDDYGLNWSSETQLTTPPNNIWDEVPWAVQAQDGKIWVVWMRGSGTKNHDIYYKTYDRLSSPAWSSSTVIVDDSGEDKQPTIFQAANTTMWIAWASDRVWGDYDIFYKYALNEHDVAVTGITPTAIAYQGYQSPIKVTVKNCGMYSETFTVTAYYDSNAIDTQTVTSLAPNAIRTLNFTWDTTSTPFGSYTNLWSANASHVVGEIDFTDNYLVSGTVLVTIPGDVSGDRTIDILDKGVLSAHWTGAPGTVYSSIADIDNDGNIDIQEVSILNDHWEESW